MSAGVAIRLDRVAWMLEVSIVGEPAVDRAVELERLLGRVAICVDGRWRLPVDSGRALQLALRAERWLYEVSTPAEAAMSEEGDA